MKQQENHTPRTVASGGGGRRYTLDAAANGREAVQEAGFSASKGSLPRSWRGVTTCTCFGDEPTAPPGRQLASVLPLGEHGHQSVMRKPTPIDATCLSGRASASSTCPRFQARSKRGRRFVGCGSRLHSAT
eukprot:scaffold3841_cov412-Prasinococcus_capsulatus_cf.AAC.17